MKKDPIAYNNPNRETLSEADISGLGQALLTLTHELWVLTDRQAALEGVLNKHGIDASAEIEVYEFDEAEKKALDQRGRELVERVTQALAGKSGG